VIWVAVYAAAIVGVNLIFGVVPLLGSFVVGGIFILRDHAQRAVGHRVLLASIAGIGVSYVMADPFVAVASAAAFGASELCDWAAYSLTKRPFRERVVLSSLVSVPVDSLVFLALLPLPFSWPALAIQIASKLAALAVLFLPKRSPAQELSR
jgi:uncharacterized PurR-regulated membrane protein YhhQ (DUF165 family)